MYPFIFLGVLVLQEVTLLASLPATRVHHLLCVWHDVLRGACHRAPKYPHIPGRNGSRCTFELQREGELAAEAAVRDCDGMSMGATAITAYAESGVQDH